MATVPNRYAQIGRWLIEDISRTVVIVGFRDTFVDTTTIQTLEYVVRENDTLPDLALRFYRIPEMWYAIADANTKIEYPLDIRNMVGETILIPRLRAALEI